MTPFDRSKDVLERISVRKVLEESNLPIEIATAIADALEAPRPEVEPTIGELKDMYTIARHVGIPGSKIDAFVKTAAMAGYIFVRATSTPQRDLSQEGK